jgi:hypothetical protein
MGLLISIPHGNEAKNIGNKREVHSTHIKLMELRQADDGRCIHSSDFLIGRTRRSASFFLDGGGKEGQHLRGWRGTRGRPNYKKWSSTQSACFAGIIKGNGNGNDTHRMGMNDSVSVRLPMLPPRKVYASHCSINQRQRLICTSVMQAGMHWKYEEGERRAG